MTVVMDRDISQWIGVLQAQWKIFRQARCPRMSKSRNANAFRHDHSEQIQQKLTESDHSGSKHDASASWFKVAAIQTHTSYESPVGEVPRSEADP